MNHKDTNIKVILAFIDAQMERHYISARHYAALAWIRERILRRMKGGTSKSAA